MPLMHSLSLSGVGLGRPLGGGRQFSGGGGVSEQARRVPELAKERALQRANEGRGERSGSLWLEREQSPTVKRSGSGANMINWEPLGGRMGRAVGGSGSFLADSLHLLERERWAETTRNIPYRIIDTQLLVLFSYTPF